MNTTQFLDRTLSKKGEYCLLALRPKDNRRVQQFYNSVGHLTDAANDLDDKGFDVYFAMATFLEVGSRKVDNIKKIKSFFLDLDCGDGKDFESQRDAITQLRNFCKKLSLPKPVIVNSGRGVHVYWILAEHVCVDDWLPVAEQLKKLCVQHGLSADPAVTSDAARVLRVPKTHNHKSDPPTEVSIISDADNIDFDVFSELLGCDPIPTPNKVDSTTSFLDAVNSNITSSFKDIMRKTIDGKGCEQLKIIVTDQENCTEPMWRAGLSIAKFCSDGERASHVISKKHEDYTPELTTEKLNNIKGPYLCTTFDEHNSDVCVNCPHWGKIKSPIVLGQKIAEADSNVVHEVALNLPDAPTQKYVIPTYPKPYFRGANGGVYMRTSNADGDVDEKMIYHNDLYVVRRLKDAELGEAIVMRLHLPKDGVNEFTVPLIAVTSREEFRKAMSKEGVAVTKMDELMTYTTTWVNELQATATADTAHRQFGWTNDKCEAFIVGNTEVRGNELRFNPPSTPTAGLFSAFEPKGTMQGWLDMAEFYNKDGMELHQYVLGTAFGSPLMVFSEVQCSTMHLHSKKGGHGKTTAMFAGASVWANPKEFVLDRKDTHASKMNRGELYHNLPLYIDELTNARGKELSDLVYQLTSGQQRARMSSGSNQERFRGMPWSLQAVTTGNASMIEAISASKNAPMAEARRALECHVRKTTHNIPKEVTDKFAKSVQDNYGHVGIPYIQYIINNVETVKKAYEQVRTRLDRLAGMQAEHGYWSAGAAANITGLLIAKKLGFINYDLKKIEQWVVAQLKTNKASVDDMTVSVGQLLNDYFTEHYNNMIWIKSTQDLRKENNNGLDTLVIPDATPRANRLVARYETDTKLAFLLPKPLKEWCAEQQIHYGQFVADLKEKMNAKSQKVRITKGTLMQLPPTHVLVVKCDADIPEELIYESGSSKNT
tara:strand:+ start:1865 stop:4684 length:2820 start_codon:yes stop_codon:yes gene_type:complete